MLEPGKKQRLRIFSDFDGTIAKRDVGNLVFGHFGSQSHWWRLVAQWHKGELEGREMWRRQAAVMRLTAAELDAFVQPLEIDPAFGRVVHFAREHGFPLSVTSDGMDAYIERILGFHGFADIPLRTNHMIMNDDGTVAIGFPWYAESCGHCANCKGAHLRRERQPGELLVYIGDGPSDVCGAQEADIVFAKKELLRWCREHDWPHFPFSSFADVHRHLEELVKG